MGIETAIIGGAILASGAASAYSSHKQNKAQKEAQRQQDMARRRAEEEARRIAMDTRPDELGASLDFGGYDKFGSKSRMSSVADFLVPLDTSLLGGVGGGDGKKKSGLGFNV